MFTKRMRPMMQVRIEHAIEARARARAKQHGRSVQGEINRALFVYYMTAKPDTGENLATVALKRFSRLFKNAATARRLSTKTK